jgi:hypothetical protein
MNTNKHVIAAAEFVLILPAALFLTAVFARTVQPLRHEPADIAQHIVTWYSVRHWTLWVLLITLPLAALLMGSVMLLRHTNRAPGSLQTVAGLPAAIRSNLATLSVAAMTLAAGLILTVVALHMLAN